MHDVCQGAGWWGPGRQGRRKDMQHSTRPYLHVLRGELLFPRQLVSLVCVLCCCQRTAFYLRDDLLLSTDTQYPLWFMLLLAGVKYRPYQDRFRQLFMSASPPYIHLIHYCVMTSPPYTSPDPRTEFAYCTGVTYFLRNQLVLYCEMTRASMPVAERACELRRGAASTVAEFIAACRNATADVSDVRSGRAYLAAMQRLIDLQEAVFDGSGTYVSSRIARAVLWAYGSVREWGDVAVGELRRVSADRGEFLGRFRADMRVADLAARYGCPGELVSMCACLGLVY